MDSYGIPYSVLLIARAIDDTVSSSCRVKQAPFSGTGCVSTSTVKSTSIRV